MSTDTREALDWLRDKLDRGVTAVDLRERGNVEKVRRVVDAASELEAVEAQTLIRLAGAMGAVPWPETSEAAREYIMDAPSRHRKQAVRADIERQGMRNRLEAAEARAAQEASFSMKQAVKLGEVELRLRKAEARAEQLLRWCDADAGRYPGYISITDVRAALLGEESYADDLDGR